MKDLTEKALEEDYVFRLTDSTMRSEALELIRRVYVRDLGHFPQDGLDDLAVFISASTPEGRVVGAMRYAAPDLRPFDFETYVDLSSQLPDRTPALIGRMAVDQGHRAPRSGTSVPLGLLREACRLSRSLGVTDLLLYTYPHLARVYRSVLFEPLGANFYHSTAASQMHILRLDLLGLLQRESNLSRTGRYLIDR